MASRSVADLVVRVTADLKSVQQGLNQAASGVSSFASKLRGGAGKAINAVATGTAALIGVTAGLATSAIASGVAYNVLQQKSLAAFKTILGSADAANKMMADLAAFSKTSPFPRQVFIQATQQMLAFGFAAKDVIPTLDAVQNAVAAAGGGAEQITEVVDILSKVQSTGKITAETLNQLGYRGIDAAKLIGEAMGTTAADIRSQITKGTLDAGKALDALTGQMATKFAGAAAGLKATWVGATDRIKGAMRDIGSAIVAPFISPQGGGYAVVWANQVADILRQLEAKIGPSITAMLAKLKPLFDGITKALANVDLGAIFDSASKALSGLAPLIAPLVAGLGALGGANIAGALGPLGALLPEINPVFAAIVALVATLPELRTAFKQLLPILGDAAKQIGSVLGQALRALMPFIHQLAASLGTTLVASMKAILPAVVALLQAFLPLVPVVGQLAVILGQTLAAGLQVIVPLIAGLVTWIANLGGPMKVLITIVLALVAAQWAWNVALTANPIGVVIVAIVLLVGAIALLVQKLGGFRAIWTAIWNACKAVAQAVWGAIRAAGLAVFAALQAYVNSWKALTVAAFNQIRAVAAAVWAGVRAGASAVANGISSAFNAVKAAVASVIDKVRDLGSWLGRLKIPSLSGSVFDTIASAVGRAVDAVKSLIGWLGKIKIPKISIPGVKGLVSSASRVAIAPAPQLSPQARGLGATGRNLSATGSSSGPTIIVQGALDPDAVARQIRRLISGHAQRVGTTGAIAL